MAEGFFFFYQYRDHFLTALFHLRKISLVNISDDRYDSFEKVLLYAKIKRKTNGAAQQPSLKDSATLSQGLLTGEFSGTVGPTTNIEARLKFTELAVPTGEALPVITADLRAEQAADGKIIFGLPLVFENKAKARQSDMNIAGTMLASAAGYAVDAQLTSQEVFIEDVQVLAALAGAAAPAPAATTPAGREAAPFWQGVNGQVALALKKLHYNDQFEVSDVTGVVRIAAGHSSATTPASRSGTVLSSAPQMTRAGVSIWLKRPLKSLSSIAR